MLWKLPLAFSNLFFDKQYQPIVKNITNFKRYFKTQAHHKIATSLSTDLNPARNPNVMYANKLMKPQNSIAAQRQKYIKYQEILRSCESKNIVNQKQRKTCAKYYIGSTTNTFTRLTEATGLHGSIRMRSYPYSGKWHETHRQFF